MSALALGALLAVNPIITLVSSQGEIAIELFPERAPETVQRLLTRELAGQSLCEVRAHGYMIWGCGAPREPALVDEIDGRAMGLFEQPVESPQPIELLWQREIMPRYVWLRDAGRPVPSGLEQLVAAAKQSGTAAIDRLKGKSRGWYLEALGYRFREGGSALRFRRGSVGLASLWPNEGSARFLIALTDLPERDGRAVVFGQVIDGWGTLERIQGLPVTKEHRTLTPVVLEGVRRTEAASTGEDSNQ